jgi:triacylglycerol lipase
LPNGLGVSDPLTVTPKLKFPIVLACGIGRFDALREQLASVLEPKGVRFEDSGHYFRLIKTRLEQNGYTTRHTRVSFAAGIEVRALELSQQVEALRAELGCAKVHIIGHSMGGLDARHMIVQIPGAVESVASLTTIGTPHHGSPIADDILARGFTKVVNLLEPFLALEGVHDLTTAACSMFNERAESVEASNHVHYSVWSSSQLREATFFALRKSWDITQAAEGDNDGLVSVRSQRWQPTLKSSTTSKPVHQRAFPFPADHLNQIACWVPPVSDFASLSPARWTAWREHAAEVEAAVQGVYLAIARELAVLESA